MLNRLPVILFTFGLAIALIGFGVFIGMYRVYPYQSIVSGIKTGKVLIQNATKVDKGKFIDFVEVAPEDVATQRIHSAVNTGLEDGIMFFGGRFQFIDLCPETGCLAVKYSDSGELIHAYPYRPEEIFAANQLDDFPYATMDFSFSRDARPVGISQYANDDLLVVFQNDNTFPFSGGVARIDPQGNPVWFRWDYSHHWPTMNEDEVAAVANLKIASESLEVDLHGFKIPLNCESGKPYLDQINLLDGDGKVLREIPLVESLMSSPYRAVLQQSTNYCDPLHLNYIEQLTGFNDGADTEASNGDFVVSLRNLSAFAIIDGQTGQFKQLVRGTFFQQHSVSHLESTKYLMFDNHGGGVGGGPSRLLMVDLENGKETTIFPTPDTPEELNSLISSAAGKIDISADRKRAIVAFSYEGKAVEVRLSDGEVLNVFTSVHDVSSLQQLPEDRKQKAALYRLYGVDYVK